jgi:hypothetical protein
MNWPNGVDATRSRRAMGDSLSLERNGFLRKHAPQALYITPLHARGAHGYRPVQAAPALKMETGPYGPSRTGLGGLMHQATGGDNV